MIIPAWYLPNAQKKIDYDAEAATFLRGRFDLPNGLSLPSPPAGWFTLLELITSQFFLNPLSCSATDTFIALAMLRLGKLAVPAANKYRKCDKEPLLKHAVEFAELYGDSVIRDLEHVIHETLVMPFQGLEMLPKGEPNRKEFIFDAEFLSSVCSCVCMTTGETFDNVLWKMPLLRAGYIRVFRARYEGEKAVARQSDETAVKAAIAEAREREDKGILHPWQIAEPFRFQPSEKQIAARPEIVKEHFELMQKAKDKK